MVTVDKLKIYGFGRFNNQEFELAPGLNVVFGGNEACGRKCGGRPAIYLSLYRSHRRLRFSVR